MKLPHHWTTTLLLVVLALMLSVCFDQFLSHSVNMPSDCGALSPFSYKVVAKGSSTHGIACTGIRSLTVAFAPLSQQYNGYDGATNMQIWQSCTGKIIQITNNTDATRAYRSTWGAGGKTLQLNVLKYEKHPRYGSPTPTSCSIYELASLGFKIDYKNEFRLEDFQQHFVTTDYSDEYYRNSITSTMRDEFINAPVNKKLLEIFSERAIAFPLDTVVTLAKSEDGNNYIVNSMYFVNSEKRTVKYVANAKAIHQFKNGNALVLINDGLKLPQLDELGQERFSVNSLYLYVAPTSKLVSLNFKTPLFYWPEKDRYYLSDMQQRDTVTIDYIESGAENSAVYTVLEKQKPANVVDKACNDVMYYKPGNQLLVLVGTAGKNLKILDLTLENARVSTLIDSSTKSFTVPQDCVTSVSTIGNSLRYLLLNNSLLIDTTSHDFVTVPQAFGGVKTAD